MVIWMSEDLCIRYSFIAFKKYLQGCNIYYHKNLSTFADHENLGSFNDHKNQGSFSKKKNIYLYMEVYIDNLYSRNH